MLVAPCARVIKDMVGATRLSAQLERAAGGPQAGDHAETGSVAGGHAYLRRCFADAKAKGPSRWRLGALAL